MNTIVNTASRRLHTPFARGRTYATSSSSPKKVGGLRGGILGFLLGASTFIGVSEYFLDEELLKSTRQLTTSVVDLHSSTEQVKGYADAVEKIDREFAHLRSGAVQAKDLEQLKKELHKIHDVLSHEHLELKHRAWHVDAEQQQQEEEEEEEEEEEDGGGGIDQKVLSHPNMKISIITSIALVLVGYTTAYPALLADELAPLYHNPGAEAIDQSYIVVLKDHVDSYKSMSHCNWVSSLVKRQLEDVPFREYLDTSMISGITHTYDMTNWRGYAGKFDDQTLDHIRRSPDVAYVERDTVVYLMDMQRNAPWGLARISHRKPLDLRTFSQYPHDGNGGEGVKVFVIDTGINIQHNDLEGRASWGVTIPDGVADEDDNGHGSHCAGTIAGKRYGVAKRAEPVAVKVLRSNGSGTMSGVLAGVNWAVEQHKEDAATARSTGKKYKGAVANMSLGGARSRALDESVNRAVENGVFFAVAAGNENMDACGTSPAAAENAMTVGASNVRDERAYFSNHGPCVDVFAPGQNILSIWNNGRDGTNTISGTSMASPHVAGLAAYFLSLSDGEETPAKIKQMIIDHSTTGALTNLPKNTRNLLAYNNPPDSLQL
ncbi:serine protease [Apophysomyces ossiformis]|uniref:Serine protease n=1 Tax=Apophysomyces ossiformis TaxID=679940 RepID=A0A8H7ESF1_9FUNG|nr:serine protease [Apophysomyces ossiformis]